MVGVEGRSWEGLVHLGRREECKAVREYFSQVGVRWMFEEALLKIFTDYVIPCSL